ncbi:MAG TPA: helix-turn-helix domain-containing protein [Burkholderiales bacterium]|nr:helix-turn-helix domain-containing protein [Burkholderiales bacterium]
MTGSGALVDVLKRELKARGITYAQVARRLNLSEASVKRMFSRRQFTLARLDQVCELAGTEFSELARTLSQQENLLSRLTPEQEKEIISDRKLLLVALCALNHLTFDQILATYDLTRAELTALLARLDRLGFIQLQPGNRIKLLVSRTFSWLPDGPIQRFFTQQAHNEYFGSRFDRPGEFMVVVSGMLSKNSSAAIVSRLKRVAHEFSELHNGDSKLPLSERSAMSLLVAIRHWELQAFSELKRRKLTVHSTGGRS